MHASKIPTHIKIRKNKFNFFFLMLVLLEPEVAEADGAAVFLDDVYEIKSASSCVKQSINCTPGTVRAQRNCLDCTGRLV